MSEKILSTSIFHILLQVQFAVSSNWFWINSHKHTTAFFHVDRMCNMQLKYMLIRVGFILIPQMSSPPEYFLLMKIETDVVRSGSGD